MIHHVPKRDLAIFGLLFSQLGQEIGAPGSVALLVVVPCDLVFRDLVKHTPPFCVSKHRLSWKEKNLAMLHTQPQNSNNGGGEEYSTFKNRYNGSGTLGNNHFSVSTVVRLPNNTLCHSGNWPISLT